MTEPKITNTWIVPMRFFRPGVVMGGDMRCPADRVYWIDDNDRVHVFVHTGMVLRPGEPGYAESVWNVAARGDDDG